MQLLVAGALLHATESGFAESGLQVQRQPSLQKQTLQDAMQHLVVQQVQHTL